MGLLATELPNLAKFYEILPTKATKQADLASACQEPALIYGTYIVQPIVDLVNFLECSECFPILKFS